MALRLVRISRPLRAICQVSLRAMSSGGTGGEWGSGVGKGGGSGGSIRSAGGTFGKIEATREEQYFRELQQEQLKELGTQMSEEVEILQKQITEEESAQQLDALKEHHHEEIASLEKQIKDEQEELNRHKKKLQDLQNLIPKE
ncbi:hypothetical protein NP493_33g03000 [Ridgeia piscesae]|uniref:ATP synthase F1 subunit epsilon n=1 Tax=Ridgeia piscesae TaxID=27915 RepID=A0AAD9PD51_RIDPI|nr:hypothetical protein NP493_33g03000 [Ridgeia piscesae]